VVNALELSAGKLIKIPQHTSSEDYSSSLSQRDATGVVAVLLGIVATHRGVQHAPLAMLAARTKVCTAHTTASAGCHEVQDRDLPVASTASSCTCSFNSAAPHWLYPNMRITSCGFVNWYAFGLKHLALDNLKK